MLKAIRISEEINQNWDKNTPKRIREFLNGTYHEYIKFLYNLLNDPELFQLKKYFTKDQLRKLEKIERLINVE